jgi:hypothetical protein
LDSGAASMYYKKNHLKHKENVICFSVDREVALAEKHNDLPAVSLACEKE